MKYLNKIAISLFLILILFGCTNYEEIAFQSDEINADRNQTKTIDLKLNKEFTISFWIKPQTNMYGSTILTLDDTKQTLTLLTNSMDVDYYSTGLILYHNNGAIYKDGDSNLDTNTYNQVVIRFKDNYFYLTLNGEDIGSGKFFKNIKNNKITLNFGGELFKGTFKNVKIENRFLEDDELINDYNSNLLYRLDNVDYDDSFKENANEKVSLPNTRFDIQYSSDSDLLKIEDDYLIFSDNNEEIDKTINLDAYTNINGIDVNKTIQFIIKGKNDKNKLEEVVDKVNNNLSYIISESNQFESEIDGCTINYEVINGEASFDNDSNKFIKESNNQEETITIKSTISLGDLSKTIEKEVTLINEYYAYLLVYFNGYDGFPDYLVGDETIYFAISTDGINWDKITQKKLISSKDGSGRFRDPYVQRTKDNKFTILATEGYINQGIYVINTNEFVDFDVNHVSFASHDRSIGLDGNEVWAPEYFYNETKDMYTITFSDPGDNCKGIYAVDTKDFESFSAPYLFFTSNSNVIDADIALIGGEYYMFYKDENTSKIHYAKTNSLSSNVWFIEDEKAIDCNYLLEGPELFIDHINNRVILYADAYENQLIMSSDVTKLEDKLDINMNVDNGITSLNEVRHFSIIELTKNEYERIVEKYGK